MLGILFCSRIIMAQNTIQYALLQNTMDPLRLTAVAYPNFTSGNVTISTAVFTFYVPAGTVLNPAVPVLPSTGTFTDITGTWRIEKITPALYAMSGNPASDMQGNDIYQCVLQNSPSPVTTSGQPVQLFTFRVPSDCVGGAIQVHTNNNSIQQSLFNAFGININNQMSVSVNDAISTDIYTGNISNPALFNCPLDDVPDAVDDVVNINEDNSTMIDVTNNDDFGNNIPATGPISITTPPAFGTATVNDNGTPNDPTDDLINYTPPANFNGTVTVSYQICDADGDCDIATVTINVNAVNDAPDANPDMYTMNEDGVLTGNVSTNDTDPDGPMTNITVVTPPTNGMLTLNPDGTFTYTPNPNFNGTDTYTYSYCDGGTPNQCDQATVTITVGPVNDPPVANDDSQTTPEDMAATFSITANDTDVDGMINLASVDLNTGLAGIQTSVTVTGGTFTYNGDGTVTFTPNANFNGTATTDYQVCDTGTPTPVQCDVATITVTVNAVNDPPVANDDSQTTPEDVAPTFSITANDTDVDGTINLASVDLNTTLPGIQTSVTVTGGTFTYNGDGTVTFTPNANFNGTATTDYQVCDTGTPTPVQCDIATITVTVNAVNDPPVANDDSQTTPEDMATTFSITGNDTDTDGTIDLASVDLNTGVAGIQTSVTVAGGTFTYNGNGTVTFTPNANFNGTATTDYQVCDTGTPTPVQCDVATITVTVNAINDPPIANDDSQTTPEDMATTFSITANDTDVDGTIDLTSVDLNTGVAGIQTSVTVTGGTFTYNGNGTVTFTPNANFNGTATTDYQVCDTGTPTPVQCDVATITVTVNAVNDPPVANDDSQTTPEDMAATFSITANDTDTDGTINLASVDLNTGVAGIQTSVTVTGGTFTYNGDGTVTFTPNANFNGTATTDYQVCDTGTPTPVQCDVATITVTVNAVNDAPDAVNDVITINEDISTPINVPANDTDVEGLNLGSVTIVTPPTNGMVSVNNMTGVVTYTPNPNFVGTDVFTYSICDNGTPILCDQATVTVTVNATSVRLLAKMRLQGALFGTNGMLMRDTLRQLNRLPATEPYTGMSGFVHFGNPGGETVGNTAVVFANNGANSIVDWVFVELRSMSNPATVVKTRAALLQRDGDVVDIDGTSALVFENTLPGNFYVAVRHRNHLGTMTAASVAMTNAGTTVDFTNLATPLWDDGTNLNGYEQATVAGAFALWAGNTNVDKSVVFAGQDNDKNTIFNQIDQAPGNSVLHSQLYVYNGYFTGDVNMDGSAIYAGQKNDVDFIFNNVDSHPRNVLRSQTYVIRQQLAE